MADTNRVKSEWIRDHLGLEVEPWRCDRTQCVPVIGLEAYEAMGAEVYGRELSAAAPAVPGALEALAELSGFTVISIVTARTGPRLPFVRAWLRARQVGQHVDTVISSAGADKLGLCTARRIEVLVDDDERHLGADDGANVHRVLFKFGEPGGGAKHRTLDVCRSWREVVEHIRARLAG